MLNKLTEDYYCPAPESDTVFMNACAKPFHSLFDCVWGSEQIDVDDEIAELLSTIIPFGAFKSKKLPIGVKQGPGIYQHMQDNALAAEYKPNGEKLSDVFFDDTHTADYTAEQHVESLTHVLKAVRKYDIQYRLTKCEFFKPEILLLGFICSVNGRRPDPKKVEQLKAWPEYREKEDIASHLAFCNYLREFFGPDYNDQTKPFWLYLKKGADFKGGWPTDEVAHAARAWLINATLTNCILAVSRPWQSGRPSEVYSDASDEGWCVCLCQRGRPGAFVCKSFVEEAARGFSFEREY